MDVSFLSLNSTGPTNETFFCMTNFKEKLSEVVVENISPISKEISKLKSDKAHILQVLKDGSEKAEAIAAEKVKKIKEIIGF